MGNIKHNDELLRVHDDGFDVVFNCDNKHQNGVSYHAEKNGKKTKIDPEYAMAALVKKISGAGWPADLPVPSAGGYGYTEQGEETTIVDNESVTTSDVYGSVLGQFTTPFDIVNGAYTVIFNGTQYNLNSTFNEGFGFWYLGDISESGPDFSQYPFMIASLDGGAQLMTESAGDYDVTIKVEPETIHKIDEKYLPSGGGEKFVVTFTVDDNNIATPNKTYSEIKEASFKGLHIVGLIPSLSGSDELQYADRVGSGGVYTHTLVYTPYNVYYVHQIICDVDENDNCSYSYVEKAYSLTEQG